MNESNMWKETDEEILQQIPEKLLKWYDQNARILPWRENPQPYRVWVSEIMLQQTRVEAVKPYFERFLKALPTVEDLAQAPEEQLLKLWEGLGYYNRVRNLQRGARAVMAEHGGVIPASFEALKSFRGSVIIRRELSDPLRFRSLFPQWTETCSGLFPGCCIAGIIY